MAPAKPTDKSFDDIVELVCDHYTPKPSAIVQRFRFHSRSQKEGESIADFVAELRRLSEHCQFEAVLNDMLCNRLVCGIKEVRNQRRLLVEPDLTFQKALEFAQASEAAEQNTKDLQQPHAVHTVQKPRSKSVAHKCYRCGGTHVPDSCRFKTTECHFCHKKGRIAKVCRSNAKQQSAPDTQHRRQGQSARKSTTQPTLQLEEEDKDDITHNLFAVRWTSSKSETTTVTVQASGANLEMEVDTGASCFIISVATYQRLWQGNQAPPLRPTNKKLCTYTRESLEIKGTITVKVHYQGQSVELELVVVAGVGPSLLVEIGFVG